MLSDGGSFAVAGDLLAVDVMEFVFIPAVKFFQMLLIHFSKIAKIVRASGIDTFMDDEVLTVFFVGKGVATVGAAQAGQRQS